MNKSAGNTLFLDLGSHSAKAYMSGNGLKEIGNTTWTLLEGAPSLADIETAIRGLVDPFRAKCGKLMAVGTEAMRRSPELSGVMDEVCRKLEISYRTLSQEEEATLIQRAIPEHRNHDIINIGGGSIQIVSGASPGMALLGFGISDLNQSFDLKLEPEHRRIEECIVWVRSQLPENLSSFIYTGGEEKYLRHLGVPLADGRCKARDFEALAVQLSRLPMEDIEAFSPHDPKWMGGAIASNCIVLACLRRSGADFFIPSDINIAHGLAHELMMSAMVED